MFLIFFFWNWLKNKQTKNPGFFSLPFFPLKDLTIPTYLSDNLLTICISI